MGKQFKRLLFLFAMLWILYGCSRPEPGSPPDSVCRVVTEITVDYENSGIRFHRQYTSSEKMQQILNYLRTIDPYGRPEEDPEATVGSCFRITLFYSDKCQTVYLQKSDRFLKTDGGEWKRIDPDRARELSRILGLMESDPVSISARKDISL